MRPNQNNKNRQRGRNNNGGRKHVNPLSRNFESNGPDVKVRGNAAHVAEKYLQLARDAQSSGDPVLAENYLQHAEHYFRIVAAAQQAQQYRDQPGAQAPEVDEDDDFPAINDRFASPEPLQRFQQPQPQPGSGDQPTFAGAEASAEEGGEQAQPQGEAATAEEGGQNFQGQQGEGGEGHRRRDRNRRRRGRGPSEGGQGGEDPSNSPQPEVALPAFLTGGNATAE
jgi:hypothetical protein